jgi:molybdopterin-containing oxidoreductase family membrane subunit
MLEKAFYGSKRYWMLLLLFGGLAALGGLAYLKQYFYGLGITGMGRDISWGVYIAQFTFLVGVAASAVMVVLPYYLHDYKKFGKIVVLGEFLAISAVAMCILFIMADMGKPERVLNVLRYPTLNSVMFWDMLVLSGYLGLNILCGWVALESERKDVPPPKWIKPFIYLSIPWAVSIHTVTAFLYAGLPGRHFWLTAIMAPRFLASAFAGGPALLILLALILRKYTRLDAGKEAIGKLAVIVTYAAIINAFFLGLEVFTAFYSNIPGHKHTFQFLYGTMHGTTGNLVPWMWTSAFLGVVAILMLLARSTRENYGRLALACGLLFLSLWIDKGLGLVLGGFVPNPLEHVVEYHVTLIEFLITAGIWGAGFLVLTVLYKVAVAVKEEKMA